MKVWHSLLQRQIKKCGVSLDNITPEWLALLEKIDTSYHHIDSERYISQRSVEISSNEMHGLRMKLEKTSKYIHSIVTDGILILDENFVIVEANHAAEVIFMNQLDQIINKNFDDTVKLYAGSNGTCVDSNYIISKLKDTNSFSVERSMLYTCGLKEKDISFSINRLPEDDTNKSGYILIVNDITKQLKTELSLKQALINAKAGSQEKSEFLATMSHELRTPLNGVIGMLQILKKDNLTDRQIEKIDISLSSANNLILIINEILDLSKLESGNLEIVLSEFDVRKEMKSIEALFSPLCQDKQMLLGILVSPSVPSNVLSDGPRFRQVMINLINNAIKFTPSGGEVIVRINYSSEEVPMLHVSVSDTGIGIDKKDLKLIFESFKQASNHEKGHFGGTGLGLTVCKKLIELMGGSISVRSTVNTGTTFDFNIHVRTIQSPLKPEETHHNDKLPSVQLTTIMKENLKVNKAVNSKYYNILVVEDNLVNQIVVSEMLALYDIKSKIANNGKEALEMMGHDKYDLIFMDCQMPVLDGFETTKRIREREFESQKGSSNKKSVKIVALTANAFESDKQACIQAGMDDHLAKPFQVEELKAILAKHLDL